MATKQRCTLPQRLVHPLLGATGRLFGDHGADIRFQVRRVTQLQRLGLRHELFAECRVHRALHEDPLRADAVLPRRPEGTRDT
ncbi:hypothetical protein D3C81_2151760 [compost metagenome]